MREGRHLSLCALATRFLFLITAHERQGVLHGRRELRVPRQLEPQVGGWIYRAFYLSGMLSCVHARNEQSSQIDILVDSNRIEVVGERVPNSLR